MWLEGAGGNGRGVAKALRARTVWRSSQTMFAQRTSWASVCTRGAAGMHREAIRVYLSCR